MLYSTKSRNMMFKYFNTPITSTYRYNHTKIYFIVVTRIFDILPIKLF